jgi:hypothetical protein
LEFLFTNLLLTPHQIGIGQEIILSSSTPHASKVFTTPITTFEETPNQQRIVVLTSLQILNQVELVEKACVEHVEKAINQPIAKD